MKITRLRAENVHGYLPIDIVFFPDLTFITGLNGSGKTSALRLLMAMLTPNLDEFAHIDFSIAAVTIEHAEGRIEILAHKQSGELTLSVGANTMVLSSSELQLLAELRRREEQSRNPVFEKVTSHPVFQYIRSISTPMFLGIDRRTSAPSLSDLDSYELRRRQMMHRAMAEDSARGSSVTSLADVNYLVASRMQEVLAEQEKLDEILRRKFFTRAFEYKPAALNTLKPPTRAELDSYKQHLQNIQSESEAVKVPLPEIRASLADFFDRMTQAVTLLERQSSLKVNRPMSSRPKGKKWEKPPPLRSQEQHDEVEIQHAQVEWLVNSPQADRILEHLKLLERYVNDRKALRDPIERFLRLVNEFLKQTKKSVEIAPSGELLVRLPAMDKPRSISALSSGERQLVVMLAHLSLNPSLAGSGVFIVDEPELSLHIDWQEKFVAAVQAANPSVQLILATHSPAIILDRTDVCVGLRAC